MLGQLTSPWRLRGADQRAVSLARHDGGASAIEFAFLAPLAAAGMLLLGLIGIQLEHYIKMDQILRAGAAFAIVDPGDSMVTQRMREIARLKGYDAVETEPGSVPGVLHVQGVRTCLCPSDLENMADCSMICPNQRPAIVRYRLVTTYREPISVQIQRSLARLGVRFVIHEIPDPSLAMEVMIR